MNKIITAILSVAGTALGAAAVPLYVRWRTRRNAAESQPKIQVLLDEMIALARANRSDLEKVVLRNSLTTINDEHRDRDLSIHAGGDWYTLGITTKLIGRKAGRVSVKLYRSRGDSSLHLYWPDFSEHWPMESWLEERLERLDQLVGTVSRKDRVDRILSRFDGGKDDEDPPPNCN